MGYVALVPGFRGHRRRRARKPDWPLIRRTKDKSVWVSPDVLPPGFIFDDPLGMFTEPLLELAHWIVMGERGEVESSKRFQWVGQDESAVVESSP